ncbi:MAG TPA: RNA polymerase sigma-70 factor [Gemmatimonadaceae bacterium]|nr:RNA polymerase sigma-70 factor [Gemmatimonadaceae bacterium]
MDLLGRLRGGDEAAFDAIFRTWYAPLVRFADSLVRSRAVAEELVQDVMLELWRRRESLAADSSLQAYLFQSTRNRSLNHIRHERVERRGDFPSDAESAVPAAASSLLFEEEIDIAVKRAISDLPVRCREVFELSRTHGLKYAEIATTLGISVKTVEAQMGKALRILREQLAQFLPGGGEL